MSRVTHLIGRHHPTTSLPSHGTNIHTKRVFTLAAASCFSRSFFSTLDSGRYLASSLNSSVAYFVVQIIIHVGSEWDESIGPVG